MTETDTGRAHKPIKSPGHISLVDQVTERLRDSIVSGKIRPGEFLPAQKALAAEFDVGLSTIHEATQRLTAWGLVKSHAGKGTWVRPDALTVCPQASTIRSWLSPLTARELYEARFVTEGALTRLAAQRATPEELRTIRDALAAIAAARDDNEFVEADVAFHLAVARAGHNRLLEEFYQVTHQLLSEVIAERVKLPEVKERSLAIQAAIAEALEEHDSDKAYQAAVAHAHYVEGMLDRYE